MRGRIKPLTQGFVSDDLLFTLCVCELINNRILPMQNEEPRAKRTAAGIESRNVPSLYIYVCV